MFELAQPWALCLLLVPSLVWFLVPPAELPLPMALKLPFFEALKNKLKQQDTRFVRHSGVGIVFCIWALLVIALAGPRWVGEPQPLTRDGYNIMLALDLSGSMELNDMVVNGRPVSRLAVVKQAAVQFVKDRQGDRLGLILFGTRAYLQTPLTYDSHAVLARIDDATVGLAGTSTSLGDALGLAIKRLQAVPPKGRMVILLTDGANNSGVLAPLKAAELAKDDGIKVYTIGLGSEVDPSRFGGLFFRMNGGEDLDETTLKAIANTTGGRYFRATDMASLQRIYRTINQLETVSQDEATVRPQQAYYPWPLALAFLLAMGWLIRQAGFRGTL